MTPVERLRLQRGAEHVQQLGPRATVELLVEIADRVGGVSAVLAALASFESVTLVQIRAAGADRLPPRLRTVPMEATR